MAEATVPYGRKTQRAPAVKEVHVLWITAGLGCDGDSVSITAATQPSIEDVLLGAIPGLPKVHLHNPVLAYENGDEFMKYWYQAEEGRLDPFVLVVEGSIPNEKIKKEGYWAALGTDTKTGQPITDHANGSTGWPPRRWRSSRSAPAPPTAAFTPWRATRPAAWAWPITWAGTGNRRRACRSSTCRAAPCSPTTSWRRCSTCSTRWRAWRPMIPLDDQLRPTWLFGKTVHEGCDRAGYYEQGDFADEYGSPKCLVKIGCWGPVVNCNVPKRGWMAGIGGCPNVGGICIGCTMPGFPDKFMPFMDEPPGGTLSSTADRHLRPRDPRRCAASPTTRSTRNRSGGTGGRTDHRLSPHDYPAGLRAKETCTMATVTAPENDGSGRARATWSRCPGTRSPASSAAWASTPRSTSPTGRSPSATAPRRSSAATASS